MNFPKNILKEHLLNAIEKIDKEGIPTDADSQYYDVVYNGKKYPPKVIVSYANIYANGIELDRTTFSGGLNTPCFSLLEENGFVIEKKSNSKESIDESDFISILLKLDSDDINFFTNTLVSILNENKLDKEDERLVFRCKDETKLILIVGQRYTFDLRLLNYNKFGFISINNTKVPVQSEFNGPSIAFYNRVPQSKQVLLNELKAGIKVELNRSEKSSFLKNDNAAFRKFCFDKSYRDKIVFMLSKKSQKMQEQVLVHEIKSSPDSQVNAKALFSIDGTGFYWDDKSFKNVNVGDYVFVVNPTGGWACFTKLAQKDINATFDSGKNKSSFNHNHNRYEVEDPDGRFKLFVRLDIIEKINLPNAWRWTIALGNSEQLYLWAEKIAGVQKRMSRVNDLKIVFPTGEAAEILTKVEIALLGLSDERKVWFVAQGKTYNENQGKKYLWAPQKDSGGNNRFYWDNVAKVKKGDIILNYSDGLRGVSLAKNDAYISPNTDEDSEWEKEGYRVDIELTELDHAISINDFRIHKKELAEHLSKIKNKPFQQDGSVNQGYLYEFTREAGKYIRDLIYKTLFGNKEIDDHFNNSESEPPNPQKPEPEDTRSPKDIIKHVHLYLSNQGFQYQEEELANFYLALKAKPFVILAGISGTGKTQLPRKFAAAIGMKESQVIQVPVRPDWTDGSDLLGYKSLDGKFIPKDLTLAIKKAREQNTIPHFFILDEMNLARVEHYFSDFLSVIETREWIPESRNIKTDPMLRKEILQNSSNAAEFSDFQWPQNLYLIGTVNMDETTHAFSRKVLDRANSLEMNEVDLNWINPNNRKIEPLSGVLNTLFATEFLGAIDLSESDKNSIKKEIDQLIKVNSILEKADLHFAYRVRDEVAFYLILNKKYKLIAEITAFDFQLMQKVLPRIHGSSERVQTVLVELLNYLEEKDFKTSGFEYSQLKDKIDPNKLKYKRSSKKILFMLKRFDDDRFTSFWL